MLIKEMRVHELCVSPGSSQFVDGFFFVKKLMSTDSIEPAEIAPLKTEKEVLAISLWFDLEPVTVDVHLV